MMEEFNTSRAISTLCSHWHHSLSRSLYVLTLVLQVAETPAHRESPSVVQKSKTHGLSLGEVLGVHFEGKLMSWPKHRDGGTAAISCRFLRLPIGKRVTCNVIQVSMYLSEQFSPFPSTTRSLWTCKRDLGLARTNAAR